MIVIYDSITNDSRAIARRRDGFMFRKEYIYMENCVQQRVCINENAARKHLCSSDNLEKPCLDPCRDSAIN